MYAPVRGAREQSLKRLICSHAFSSAGPFYPSEQSRHGLEGIEVVPAAQLAELLLGGIRAEFHGRRGPHIPKDQGLETVVAHAADDLNTRRPFHLAAK